MLQLHLFLVVVGVGCLDGEPLEDGAHVGVGAVDGVDDGGGLVQPLIGVAREGIGEESLVEPVVDAVGLVHRPAQHVELAPVDGRLA